MQDVDLARPPASAAGGAAPPARFVVGDWRVDVAAQELRSAQERVALEPRQMAVLAVLCRRAGELVSADELLETCWPAQPVGDNPVHKAIAHLRRVFHDSATRPVYIETVRRQGYRLIAPTRVLLAEGPRSREGGWGGKSPFRGLEAFDADHASVFFGRDGDVAQLRASLQAQWARRCPLVLLIGPSGSGKTSLLQAGLVPALTGEASGDPGVLRACAAATADFGDPGGPWMALAGALLDWEQADAPLLSGYSVTELAADLQARPEEVLRALQAGLRAPAPWRLEAPPLLVLDRLEALFQPPHASVAAPLVETVERLVRSGLLAAVGSCRNDFYASLAAHPLFTQGKATGGQLDLAPPGVDAIAQMIRLPARAAGLAYGTDPSGLHRLDDRLCADAAQARDALPLLQYTLQSLYLARAPGELLTWEAYDALGGLEGAIGRRAETVLEGLPDAQQQALDRLLPRLVGTFATDDRATGRWAPESAFGDADEAALARALVDARLLVADRVGDVPGVRIAHEALLRRWPRVADWIARHRAALAVRDELLPWVRRWVEGGRASAMLLPRGATLLLAVEAAADAPRVFDDDEREYLVRSQARLRRLALARWGAVGAVLVFAVAAGFVAWRNAQLERIASERERQSQRLASFMLGDLADRLRPLGKLELLGSIGEQGEKLLGRPGQPGESAQDTLQRAKALVVIGEVDGSRGSGRTAVAQTALREAWSLLEPLRGDARLPVADYYKTLGAAAFWQGQIAYDAGDFDEAGLQMTRYREAGERWRALAPQDPQARAELGFALGGLGMVAFRKGAWRDAGNWAQASLALKQEALAARPDDADALEAVANARTTLGEVAYIQGETRRALAEYDAAAAVEATLRDGHPDQLVRQRDESLGQLRRAEALGALGRRDEALAAIRQAQGVFDRLVQADPANRRWAAERLHLGAAAALASLDAGRVGDADLPALRARLDAADAALRKGYLWRAAGARLGVAEAQAAASRGDAAAAQAADRTVAPRLEALLAERPRDWQLTELRARLEVALATLPSTPETAARCSAGVRALQPAVDSGQGGLVLDAWLHARRCAGMPAADALARRLTAGGYRPVGPPAFPTLPSSEEIPR